MDGEENGTQANQQAEEKGEQAEQGSLSEGDGAGADGNDAKADTKLDYEATIAEREEFALKISFARVVDASEIEF